MGEHGLVTSGTSGQLMTLHDALRLEFERAAHQVKTALQTLEQLNLTNGKHEKTVISSPARRKSSHHHLVQVWLIS